MDESGIGKVSVGQIYSSLRRSRARMDLYHRLCDIYPSPATVKDLSVYTRLTMVNVLGALVGEKDSYNSDYSLVGMGLVECLSVVSYGETVEVFRAAERGWEMRRVIMEYARRLNFLEIELERAEGAGRRVWME
ncbi:MAG TPA: archaellum operon transcriptional activator EarA family protein [Methanocella sp.]|nr:archaellum operon transcriptional activator EarA family protein [Methanocella sp.]